VCGCHTLKLLDFRSSSNILASTGSTFIQYPAAPSAVFLDFEWAVKPVLLWRRDRSRSDCSPIFCRCAGCETGQPRPMARTIGTKRSFPARSFSWINCRETQLARFSRTNCGRPTATCFWRDLKKCRRNCRSHFRLHVLGEAAAAASGSHRWYGYVNLGFQHVGLHVKVCPIRPEDSISVWISDLNNITHRRRQL